MDKEIEIGLKFMQDILLINQKLKNIDIENYVISYFIKENITLNYEIVDIEYIFEGVKCCDDIRDAKDLLNAINTDYNYFYIDDDEYKEVTTLFLLDEISSIFENEDM